MRASAVLVAKGADLVAKGSGLQARGGGQNLVSPPVRFSYFRAPLQYNAEGLRTADSRTAGDCRQQTADSSVQETADSRHPTATHELRMPVRPQGAGGYYIYMYMMRSKQKP